MSFAPYPEYKDSGIKWLGPAPSHWPVKRLRHVARLNPGKGQLRRLPPETEVTFLPMEAVGEDGSLDRSRTRPLGDLIEGYTYIGERDVAFAKITPCFENGKAALATDLTNELAFASTEFTVLRPDTRSVSARYLYRLVTSRPFRELGEASMYGAGGQKRVPDNFARDFTIPLPPPDEQRQIADFLDHETARIDALTEEQQQLIRLLHEQRQTVISSAVTRGIDPSAPVDDSGVDWLGDVPTHWTIKKFIRCAHIAEGLVDPKTKRFEQMNLVAPNHIESGTGRVRGVETAAAQGAESGKYYCYAGDVLYSKIRPALRKACRADADCLCSADMYPLRPMPGINSRFLLWIILSEPFSRIAVLESERVAMPKINRESLGEIQLAVPPLEEQESIVEFIESTTHEVDALQTEAESAINFLKERRSALISAAVTGKIDVREWDQSMPSAEQPSPQVAETEGRYG